MLLLPPQYQMRPWNRREEAAAVAAVAAAVLEMTLFLLQLCLLVLPLPAALGVAGFQLVPLALQLADQFPFARLLQKKTAAIVVTSVEWCTSTLEVGYSSRATTCCGEQAGQGCPTGVPFSGPTKGFALVNCQQYDVQHSRSNSPKSLSVACLPYLDLQPLQHLLPAAAAAVLPAAALAAMSFEKPSSLHAASADCWST
jgi:hypothetical protein